MLKITLWLFATPVMDGFTLREATAGTRADPQGESESLQLLENAAGGGFRAEKLRFKQGINP